MRKRSISLLILAISLLPIDVLGDAKTQFRKAMEKLKACRFAEAKRDFEMILKLYPQDQNLPRVLYHLAELEANPEKALTHYQRILSDHPRSGVADSALFRVGLHRMASRRYVDAGDAFTKLLRAYPGTRLGQKVRYWLGISYLERKDRVSAIGELKETVRISPDSEYGVLAKRDLERLESGLKPSGDREHLPGPSPQGQYLVQVGSFTDFQVALSLRRRLEETGYPVSFDEAVVENRTFYRVRVGPYATRDEARRVGERLAREEHLKCWIVKMQP